MSKKRLYSTILALLLLCTSACTSSRSLREEIKPVRFEQALEGETAYIHLHSGRMLTAERLYANPDAVHYARRREDIDFRAVPTQDIAFINVTRSRNQHKVSANYVGGLLIGLATGASIYGVALLRARDQACSGSHCLGEALAVGWAKLSIPALGLLGGTVGGLANIRRPRDTYYIQVKDGRVGFVKQ